MYTYPLIDTVHDIHVPDSVDGYGCRLLAAAAAAVAAGGGTAAAAVAAGGGTAAAVAAGSSFGGRGLHLAEGGCKMQIQWPMLVC